ncbi:MAG: hypothetical protein K0R76_70 [Alphaproteobacteria bacterium]|jgi:hypothetical protein|nr:hypothetical protein [Alphaproteobacteria bacterium]MDF3033116.1 hypothetical protein [Alphaproteobacteria bacterium]
MKIYSVLYISKISSKIRQFFAVSGLCIGLNSYIIGAAEEVGNAAQAANTRLVKLTSGELKAYFNCDIMGGYEVFHNNIKIATLKLGHYGNAYFLDELEVLGFLDGSWIDTNVELEFEHSHEEKGYLNESMKVVTLCLDSFIKKFREKNHLMVNRLDAHVHESPAPFQGFRGLINTQMYNMPKVLAAKEAGWSVSRVLPTTGAETKEDWIIQYPPLAAEE